MAVWSKYLVCLDEVSDMENIFRRRFDLVVKDEGTDQEVWKARYVVQTHRDRLKYYFVDDIRIAR